MFRGTSGVGTSRELVGKADSQSRSLGWARLCVSSTSSRGAGCPPFELAFSCGHWGSSKMRRVDGTGGHVPALVEGMSWAMSWVFSLHRYKPEHLTLSSGVVPIVEMRKLRLRKAVCSAAGL